MLRAFVTLTTVVLLAAAPAAAQQSNDGVGKAIGNILSGVLNKDAQSYHGHVVSATGQNLIVRGDDGRTYTADMRNLPAAEWRNLQPGDEVTLAATRGSSADTLVAERIQVNSTGSYGTQPSASVPTTGTPSSQTGYQRIHGYVQSIGVSNLTLKTDSGQTVNVDVSGLDRQMTASTRPGDVVSVTGQMTGNEFRASVLQKE
jgi:translation initiation factor IF-1